MFAHEVVVSTVFRTRKEDGKKKVKKEADTELLFIDMATKQVVSRIVLPMSVLEALPETITESIKKVKKELKSKEIPKKPKVEVQSTSKNYLG